MDAGSGDGVRDGFGQGKSCELWGRVSAPSVTDGDDMTDELVGALRNDACDAAPHLRGSQ